MQVTAKLRYLRISTRKVRLVAGLIKGLKVADAEKQLQFLNKRSAEPVLKLLRSAVANAEHNAKMSKDSLKVESIMVGEGPTLKRWMPRAMGRASAIRKRTSHITIVLKGDDKLLNNTKTKVIKTEAKESVGKTVTGKKEGGSDKRVRGIKKVQSPKKVEHVDKIQNVSRMLSRQAAGGPEKGFRRKTI